MRISISRRTFSSVSGRPLEPLRSNPLLGQLAICRLEPSGHGEFLRPILCHVIEPLRCSDSKTSVIRGVLLMPNPCRFVLPNTSEMNRNGRGGLLTRLELGAATGCDLIEVPADFIKNRTEVRLTGLQIGTVLDRKAISILYRSECVPATCRAVLHTEPEINLSSNAEMARSGLGVRIHRNAVDVG
jgi:hypothetical protein